MESVHLRLNLLLLFAVTPVALAHDPGLSNALISLHRDKMEVALTFARKDAEELLVHATSASSSPLGLTPALRSTNRVQCLSKPQRRDACRDRGAGLFSALVASLRLNKPAGKSPEVTQILKHTSTEPDHEALAKLVSSEFHVECDRRHGVVQGLTIRSDDQNNTSVCWVIPFVRCSGLKIESSLLRHLPRGHRQYLAVRIGNRQALIERLLSAQDPAIEILIPEVVETSPSSAISFLNLGVKHILTGYDHLLFLFGLLLVTRRFSSALRIITCFTIAHSITLALATLSPVPAPPRLVEPLIAASIVYVGLENLARAGEPKGRWVLTFLFGLIHGCGFASALRELGIGAGGRGVALPLICFNGGVELGQLMIAAVLLPLIWKAQARPAFVQRFVPASSAAVVLLGGYWLVERLWMS